MIGKTYYLRQADTLERLAAAASDGTIAARLRMLAEDMRQRASEPGDDEEGPGYLPPRAAQGDGQEGHG